MRFSSPSRLYFFIGWVAWLFAAWALIGAELLLRQIGLTDPYRLEAYCAMLAPIAVIALADRLSIRHYSATWRLLSGPLGTLIVDGGAIDELRADLRHTPFLHWAAPPERRSSSQQLLAATLWLPALITPAGGHWWPRFGEWLVDGLALFCLPPAAAVCFIAFGFRSGGAAAGLLLVSLALGALGYSLVRFAGRRQAVADYFRAWQLEAGLD